jgi:hypothetical protein
MNRLILASFALAAGLGLGLSTAQACGEGQFNSGQGLPYQSYLAPRPATVLIYANPDPTTTDSARQELYAGLEAAGHKVTVVADASALADTLREQHYDVLITSFDSVDAVAAATATAGETTSRPALLPVVARKNRNDAQVRSRFAAFLTDGASLHQYLKMIGKALPANAL